MVLYRSDGAVLSTPKVVVTDEFEALPRRSVAVARAVNPSEVLVLVSGRSAPVWITVVKPDPNVPPETNAVQLDGAGPTPLSSISVPSWLNGQVAFTQCCSSQPWPVGR